MREVLKNKKFWLIAALVVLVIVVLVLLFAKEEKEVKKPKESNENVEQVFKEKTGYDVRLRETIQNDNYINNNGDIKEGHKFNKEYYLTINQTGVYTYSDDYPGDILIWVKEKNGQVTTERVSKGDKLLNVLKNGDTPFFKQNGHIYFVYFEKEGNEDIGYIGKGYVYEAKEDGTIKKNYETEGSFHSLKKDTQGRLLLTEKVYSDGRNMYPVELRPYTLKMYRLTENEWKFVEEKKVNPVEEKVEETEEAEKQAEKEQKDGK